MKPHQIESWALKIIDRVEANQPIEDFRVELKSDWIPAEKAARRIAGHANASRGAPILWLIGVGEERGVTGARHEDLADWYAKVKAQFDGWTPQLTDLNIPVEQDTVVALLFETERVPTNEAVSYAPTALSGQEEKEVMERLRSLGYMD